VRAEIFSTELKGRSCGRPAAAFPRSTFIIDEDGGVQHVIPKASPKTHDDEVLKALAEARPA
jgi:peroxiredoxin